MAIEKENINTGTGDESKPEDVKQESWMDNALEKIDSEFPLSGGETNEDLEKAESAMGIGNSHVIVNEPEKTGEEINKDKEKPTDPAPHPDHPSHPDHPEHHSWLKNAMHKVEEALGKLDTDFPLSGG